MVVKLAIKNAITNPNESPKQKLRFEVWDEPHTGNKKMYLNRLNIPIFVDSYNV